MKKEHTFWNDKPVSLGHEKAPITTNILSYITENNLNNEYSIGCIQDESDFNEVVSLLKEHYISTDDNLIKIQYKSFLLQKNYAHVFNIKKTS